MDAPRANWLRILGWGLLTSVLIHWAALDLLGGTAWLPIRSESGPLVLQVDVSRAAQAEPLSSVPEVKPQLVRDTHVSTPAPKHVPEGLSLSASAAPILPTAEHAPFKQEGVEVLGLRSAKPAEAMVAMRIALSQRLERGGASLDTLPRSVLVFCEFDEAGVLRAVHSDAGAWPALQQWVWQGAAALVVPPALSGRAFTLDVLLEFADD